MNEFVFRDVTIDAGTKSVTLQLLQCEPLAQAGFTHAFTTRLGGVSSLPDQSLSLGNFRQDSAANILENRHRLLTAMNALDWQLITASQIHSAEVQAIDNLAALPVEPFTCDALTTALPRTLLAIQTADCMPILLADQRTRAVAAVHAGWRGTAASIVARTVAQMQSAYGTQPADLLVAFGPTIQAANFEVGAEVVEQFERTFAFAATAISQRQPNGKAQLDLSQINRSILGEAGVANEQIFDCGLCTVEQNDRFFSYRRERGAERPVGRMMGLIGRE